MLYIVWLLLIRTSDAVDNKHVRENRFQVEYGDLYDNFLRVAHTGLKANAIEVRRQTMCIR